MSKSTNTVVFFDWKTVIYIYVCGECRTQFMLPMENSVIFTSACANAIIPSINRTFVYKAKEGGHVRMIGILSMFYLTIIHIGGKFISVLASNVVSLGFELRSVQNKDYSIGIFRYAHNI